MQHNTLGSLPVYLLVLAAIATGCGQGEGRTVYVERLGNDTLSIEEFTTTDDGIEGRVILRSPMTRVVRYSADLSPEAEITRLTTETTVPETDPGQAASRVATTTLQADSAVTVVEQEGGEPQTSSVAVPDGTIIAVPKTPLSVAFLQHAIGRAMASGGDTVQFTMLSQGGRAPSRNALVRVNERTYSLDLFGSPMLVEVNESGKVIGVSGRETTMKVETRLADATAVDLDSLAAEFAARDARGEGFGVASPPAELQAEIAGANFEVRYSQPAKRGREIFGGIVPWDAVWRTGANAATQFTTDRNITIGGATVPAGTYTLWSLFTPDSATLIINQQTGQWGTQYDASQDLARIPMNRTELSQSLERFTIAFEETASGAVLKLMWDTSEFSVPIAVRR